MTQGFQIATDTLRTEATLWDKESKQLGAIATKAGGLQLTRLEAGIFQVVVGAYNAVDTAVTDRCTEGAKQMTDIGTTLRQVAATYDEEEKNNTHRLLNLR